MNEIEIVSHCWGGDLPIYPHLLRAQGLSIIHHSQHKCRVVWTICYNTSDDAVVEVLDELEPALFSAGVHIKRIPLSVPHLFERSIGRNVAALSSQADCVWFCDCDYLFSGSCFDLAINQTAFRLDSIVYPRIVSVTSHQDGDGIIRRMGDKKELTEEDLALFYGRTERKAIGGIQIVNGDLARFRGYLDGTKWQKPKADTSRGNFSTVSDVKYRSYIGKQVPTKFITGVHRIRHSHRAYGGTVVD